jgi:phosphate transport system permease protein
MWKEKTVHILLLGSASTSILVVMLIFLFMTKEAVPFLYEQGIAELFDTRWIPVSFQKVRFGLIPLITGSVLITSLATLFTIPFSVFCAVYIAEIARTKEREILKPFIEIMSAIPSVVLGFFGLVVLAPVVKKIFGLYTSLNALTGSLLLALMAIPTVVSISEDAIRSVPISYKKASLALGASEMQTIWKVTVPAALPGIIAAIMLGVGRIIGETMVVLMVTGNAAIITLSPFESVRTMTATIAAEMGEVSFGSVHYNALFCVGVVLLLITFGLNILAQRVLKKYGMK